MTRSQGTCFIIVLPEKLATRPTVFIPDAALGSDIILEDGGGIDRIDFSATTGRNVTIDLSNAAPQIVNAGLTLTLSSATSIENVTGGSMNDTITGNSLDNGLAGGPGNDTYLFDTDLSLEQIRSMNRGAAQIHSTSAAARLATSQLNLRTQPRRRSMPGYHWFCHPVEQLNAIGRL